MRQADASYDILDGDLLAFSGADVGSDLIALGTWGIPRRSVTHVGVVAESPAENGVLLFEATAALDLDCALQQKRVAGIQAHRIDERIDGYRGHVWRYPLAQPLSDAQSFDLTTFCVEQLGRAYDFVGAWRARQAGFGWLWRKLAGVEDLTALFCSEFVAAAYRQIGVWAPGNPSSWSPRYLCRELRRQGVVDAPRRLR